MKKYLDAEEFKEKVKKKRIRYSWEVEELIDKDPGVHIATELDEVAGGTTVLFGTETIAFQNEYVVNHFDEAVKYLKDIVEGRVNKNE